MSELEHRDTIVRLLSVLEGNAQAEAAFVADPKDVFIQWSVARIACEARELIEKYSPNQAVAPGHNGGSEQDG